MKRLPLFLGILLAVLGVVGLVHPNFSYHQREEVAKVGPFKATVDEEKTAQVPAAVSIIVLTVGIVMIAVGSRTK
ncbi:MAG TPA: hypothetical protein VJO16_03545 [Candidatus Acidoferrum sp.]|nr:hypothetical protein [Candidatus Acidoferrum sp.]